MKKIVLGREAYDQIMYYVNKTNFEISGLGAVEIIDGIPTVTKVYLLDQENSMAETEMSGDAISKLIYEHHVSGHPGDLKFWWHSHVNMEVFWSGTDMKTIGELTENGWFIHGVFNKSDEFKLAYTTNDPCPIMIDDIDLEIDEELVSLAALKLLDKLNDENKILESKYDEQFEEKITIKTFTPTTMGHTFPNHQGSSIYVPDWNKDILPNEQDSYKAGEFGVDPTGSFTDAGYIELIDEGYTDNQIAEFNRLGAFCLNELDSILGVAPIDDAFLGWTNKA